MPDVSVTWLGHAAFRMDSPNGKRIYVDPWLDNPKCPENEQKPERADIVAITHGHSDHVGSAVEIAKEFSPEIIALVELKEWLGNQGADVGQVPGPNKGGTVEIDGIKFTDAASLGKAIHDNPATTACLTNSLYRYAVGRDFDPGEREFQTWLGKQFAEKNYRVTDLMKTIATSDAFFAVRAATGAVKEAANHE